MKKYLLKAKTYLEKIVRKRFFVKLDNIDLLIRAKSKCDYYEIRCLENESLLIEKDSNSNMVVSLTTYSKRIYQVHLVIESLGNQTIKPNRIILWLDENEFDLDNIPLMLKNLTKRGLEIKFVPNFKSYKKLLFCLAESPNSNIITVDDDILYPCYFIEGFEKELKKSPETVLAYRGHKIQFDKNGNVEKYSKWDLDSNDTQASKLIFPTGVGGVLYPVDSLHQDVLNYELASKLAPHGDDIWFKAMSLRNNRMSKLIRPRNGYEHDFIEIPMGQDISLFHQNVMNGGNNSQIKDVFEHFDLLKLIK
ncbi:glycosyl transferase [Vibrio viridaestus]|uniref:Glycosyl transferase n=1 Tax=Vibrio viridaestus TaxID=2487322 RepID=A0A3N9THX0_9VIBR|nr:glycosyl transferase [Vibrio viridaestus]RQW63877.1 glycosyl transferase [Vibrio viridaestus]